MTVFVANFAGVRITSYASIATFPAARVVLSAPTPFFEPATRAAPSTARRPRSLPASPAVLIKDAAATAPAAATSCAARRLVPGGACRRPFATGDVYIAFPVADATREVPELTFREIVDVTDAVFSNADVDAEAGPGSENRTPLEYCLES